MISNPIVYQTGGGGDKPVLLITVTGATPTSVTASKSGTSVSLDYDSTIGKWWAFLPSTGTWTVTATWSTQQTKSVTVAASTVAVYEISLSQPRLPVGYVELEYIESNVDAGPQIAIASTFQKSTTTFEIEFQATPDIITYPGAFCFLPPTAPSNYIGASRVWTDAGNIYVEFCGNFNSTGGRLSTVGSIYDRHTYNIDKGSFYIDGVIKGNVSSATTNAVSGVIYTPYNAGGAVAQGVAQSGPGKIYHMKKLESGTLQLDCYPAKRNSDSVIGLYDVVGNNFIPNSGTGSFIGGPEV